MSDLVPAIARIVADVPAAPSTTLICLPKPTAARPIEAAHPDPGVDERESPAVEIFASGMNGALQRHPKVRAISIPLLDRLGALAARWRPVWSRVPTISLTFPAGSEFLPAPKSRTAPSDSQGTELVSVELPALAAAHVDAAARPQSAATRVKPPPEAISIEDRLFYLLQPPLETWLKGQELIMPFEPFPYQYEGIAWLFSQKAALLADEMGLGKTMQTITAIRLLLRAGQVRRILLICPKPLIPNWQREFRMWAEELPVITIEGDAARRQMLWMMPGVSILLANYELLVRDMEALDEQPPQFDLLILDEAQRIKNRDSRTATAARGIPRKRSWALTGTPIENRPEELASLYEYMEVVPPRATPDIRQLTALSKQFILRRTKDLVMKDLPPRLDRDEYLELAPAQRLAYDTAEKEGVIQLDELGESISIQHVFELVLRLKQITNFDPLTGESAKLERLEAEMEEIAACGGKAILFSQWTGCIDWLERRLARFRPLIYHGKVPTAKREPILKRFKEDAGANLLMMSYGTGAVGLNLQFAGYVFLFDRWWNPAIEDQAINRAHRIGQKSRVIVTRFISKDTIEERINRVLDEKRQLFATVLGEGKATNVSLSLSASEIFGLFELKARHGKGTREIQPIAPAA
jgi:SNF2 family DNA or RNA helicase